jgi:hypothetical protein
MEPVLVPDPEAKLTAAGILLQNEIKKRELKVAELESTIYAMFGMLRLYLPVDKNKMTDAQDFVKKIAPMAVEISKKIRYDAVDRVIAYLNGMGYIFDPEIIEKLKEASTNIRRKDLEIPASDSPAKISS